ncbi:hypothetical protein ETB97_004157 [Aspergillus alliaceus]|uniref:Mis12-Mtw1 family protein n=1 Tax=Petromyces alliaceus TaxID=209559 RepID=A0A8H6AB82_PETAA|nr:hypothetical protein ETB97_004157 [Aspergillus burnettii]
MTVTVLETPRIKTKRREPLKSIDMATSQARARPASSAAPGRKETRSSTGLSLSSVEKNEEKTAAKRKQDAFNDEDEGFQFTRIKTKKSKPTVETIPELPQPPEGPAPKPSPRRGRPPKKRPVEKSEKSAAVSKKSSEGSSRQTRATAKSMLAEPEAQPASATRSTRRRDHVETVPLEKKRKKGRPSKSHEDQRNGYVSPEPQAGTSKITLPVADTPVIQRNKELRGAAKSGKGNRRSSLGMRGRRASSLIDSGASNALPHDQVDTAEFYKHIASDLPEPRRMRQLLIWCATRAMGDKRSGERSEDASARLAARVIQEELLKDFSTNSQLSNWFEREDVDPPAVVVKKPNPKNIQNADKIKELEEQIQRLQRERHALNALLRPPSIPQIKPSKQDDSAANGQSEHSQPESEPIDLSLLDPSQQKIYESIDPDSTKRTSDTEDQAASSSSSETCLPPVTPSAVSTRLSRIARGLAPTLDSLAAGIHDIELYRTMSDTVSSRVLRICAERLEERDTRNAIRRLAGEEGESKDLTLRPRPREDLSLILGALSRVEGR